MATDTRNQKVPEIVPAGQKKEFLSFIKTLASFKGDLSSFTAPTFILSTTSMVEYPAYWAEQPSRFIAPACEADPEKRALLVLSWFLSTLKQQYDHRKDRKKGKPLNPILGEVFLGRFEDDSFGPTQVVSEQVCHHPPVTAFKIWNEDNEINLTGFYAAKTFFANRMIHMHKVGHAVLQIDKYDEEHVMTFPQLHLEGFLPPPPYMELGEAPVFIHSSSGFVSKIQFSGKGWLRGKRNSLSATLYRDGKESEPLYTASGQWSGKFEIRNVSSGKIVEEYDASLSEQELTSLTLAPLEIQDPMESRKLWADFVSRMDARDISGAGAEKNRIEVEQRQLRQEEEKEGRAWKRRYFKEGPLDSKIVAALAKSGYSIPSEQAGGYWHFGAEDLETAKT